MWGKLQITKEIERFACMHCGNGHVVKRGGGVVSISPITEGLRKIHLGPTVVGQAAYRGEIRNLKGATEPFRRQR